MCVVQTIAVSEDTIPFPFRAGCRLGWRHQIVFPVGDRRDQLLQQDFVIFNQPFRQLFKQRHLVGIIEKREVGLHPQRRVFALDNIQPQRVEGGDHQPARLFTAQRLPHTLFHLARRFVGKRYGSDVPRLIPASTDQVGDFIGDDSRFARSRTRQHQAGSGDEFDGLLLSGV